MNTIDIMGAILILLFIFNAFILYLLLDMKENIHSLEHDLNIHSDSIYTRIHNLSVFAVEVACKIENFLSRNK